MRVKKIMNWPLTIFTLTAIVVIILYGSWLARTAVFSGWGQEHIDYDQAADSLQSNMEGNLNNRMLNMQYLGQIIERGICRNETELINALNVVASSGQWDLFGYQGDFGVLCTMDGKRHNIRPSEGFGKQVVENDNFFFGEFDSKVYLVFSDSIYFQTEKTTLFFALEAERLLRESVEQSEVRGNAAALIIGDDDIIATVNMKYPLKKDQLDSLNRYHNPDGKVTSAYIEELKSFYSISIREPLMIAKSSVPLMSARVAEDSGEDEAFLSNYSIRYEGEYIWYQKEVTIPDFGDITIYSGKQKELTSRLLELILYIGSMYIIMIVLLCVMFVMQIVFTVHSNKKLVKIAYIDPVTKMRNWNRFVIDAGKLLRTRRNHNYAMVIFDIDRFKVYNELYGHDEGNKLLKKIAGYLSGQLRSRELLTRCGADHFTMLLINRDDDEFHERLIQFRDEMKAAFADRSVDFTIGANRMLDYTQTIDHMYTLTLFSQENSKLHRDVPIYYFCEIQRQMLLRENELENSMVSALQNKEYKVYLQPKFTSDGSRIGGAEALVRWVSDKMGFISPGEFIPLFERNGFVVQLDNYMLNEVCALQKQWMDQGKELITISVNISRIHLMDPKLIDDVSRTVDSYKLPHSCLELELTESAFFEAKDVLIATIKKFQELGFEVSMDDFGSGYSSLNSLKDLPLNVIKLDGEFFKETEDAGRGTSIVTDTIQLAKHLNMKIVAEGIEKKEQVDFLREMGCDLIQGYYFARPMPVEDFEKAWKYTSEK